MLIFAGFRLSSTEIFETTMAVGKAVLSVNLTSNNVQVSNFGSKSFQLTNTGEKAIAQVEIDVTNALYPDSMFDLFGQAGDTASKPLTIDNSGNTGIVAPSNASYIGTGGAAGYRKLRLVFNPNVNVGFNPGETLGFSIDIASAGSMLSLLGGASGEIGTATFTFSGATGSYNVILGTFDENDGIATFQLTQNGTLIGSVSLNQNLGGNAASAATKVEKLLATNVTLTTGSTLKVTGFENGDEHARFDFICFEPVSAGGVQPAVESPVKALIAQPKTAKSAASRKLTALRAIASDMTLPHEGKPAGVPDHYSWANEPEIIYGNEPGRFRALIAWGQVYTDAAGNPAQNTRVHIKNIKTYVLNKKTGKWILVQKSRAVEGAAYREDFVDDVNIPADMRYESDGGISVKLTPGYNFHFWTKGGRAAIRPKNIGGVITSVKARLIVDDPNLADDRSQARILMSMGGDYWLDQTAKWDYFKTHGPIATGRFRYIGKQWDQFNMTTLTRKQLIKNPPPASLIKPRANTPPERKKTIVATVRDSVAKQQSVPHDALLNYRSEVEMVNFKNKDIHFDDFSLEKAKDFSDDYPVTNAPIQNIGAIASSGFSTTILDDVSFGVQGLSQSYSTTHSLASSPFIDLAPSLGSGAVS